VNQTPRLQNPSEHPAGELAEGRREAIQKLGKFAVYAAPFTVLAMTAKAASTSGPFPSSRSAGRRK
jgi:hypothetical protein